MAQHRNVGRGYGRNLLPAPLAAEFPAYVIIECTGRTDPTDELVELLAPVPEVGDAAVAALDLDTYYLFHATRAELLTRLARYDDAASAYDRALELTSNAAERALLERKRGSLPAS